LANGKLLTKWIFKSECYQKRERHETRKESEKSEKKKFSKIKVKSQRSLTEKEATF
jgi:hypothetical protein